MVCLVCSRFIVDSCICDGFVLSVNADTVVWHFLYVLSIYSLLDAGALQSLGKEEQVKGLDREKKRN